MADLIVEVVKIKEVVAHENADRLQLAKVFGYTVVVGLDQYKPGDHAVYFPVDSILPDKLRDHIFSGGKITPVSRIRAAKIRGAVSQGLLVEIPKIAEFKKGLPFKLGTDLTEKLGVTKHDPEKNKPAALVGQPKKKRDEHPLFSKYTKIQHLLKHERCFEDLEQVFVTEKIHGTNFRAGWVPAIYDNWIDRWRSKITSKWLMRFKLPVWKFVFGSHNVELKPKATTYYNNVYEQCVLANNLESKIPLGEVWYGEIFGFGIQKNYSYGCQHGEFDVRFFDIKNVLTGEFYDFSQVITRVAAAGEQVVPWYVANYDLERISAELNRKDKRSHVDNNTVPEGVVIRSYNERKDYLGSSRRIMKLIGEKYLLMKDNTENK